MDPQIGIIDNIAVYFSVVDDVQRTWPSCGNVDREYGRAGPSLCGPPACPPEAFDVVVF
jgi:hypothetical protein